MDQNRKVVILTEGLSNPHQGKTARNMLYYKPEEVLAIYDRYETDKNAQELFGFGDSVPVIDSLDKVPNANTLLIGVAVPGGKLPETYRTVVLDAISRKMDIVSGLHTFLSDDIEISSAAKLNGVSIHDVRKNNAKEVAHRKNFNPNCMRVHTIGNDCSVGKMIASMEIVKTLQERNEDAYMAATGQTGIIIQGAGCPIDGVVGDYINGAAEQLVLAHQHHNILFIEGQGSLAHPRYSSVTLGLLHGCIPHAMILCYELGREYIHGMDNVKIPPLDDVIASYQTMANLMFPSKIIGFAINGRKSSKADSDRERDRIKEVYGLPACDVFRHGADELADAVLAYKKVLGI